MTQNGKTITRRQFIQAAATAASVPTIVSASSLGFGGVKAPSDRITLGVVGLGARASQLISEFLRQSDAQIVSICDVDSLHYRDRPWGKGQAYGREPTKERIEQHYAAEKSGTKHKGLQVVDDFRQVCSRDDIDAVVVATPDHWHALCTVTALRSGKDVYCEKPVTHAFAEGQIVCGEVAKQKAVFQTGSQQRSDQRFRQAVELVMNGHLGKVRQVEVGLPPGYDMPMGDTTVKDPPEHLDYDFWCGPSRVLPYMRARHHRWWRGHSAYGGGVLMDFIGHNNDIAHWGLGMDRLGPMRVEARNWKKPLTDIYDTPREYEILCDYPGEVTVRISSRNPIGIKFIGEEGWIYVNRSRLSASDKQWTKTGFGPGPKKAYASPGHVRNFLDCVKSRAECVAPAETAHRSITPGHLGYVSNQLSRPLRWDAKREQVIDDNEADKLLRRHQYRKPWSLQGTASG